MKYRYYTLIFVLFLFVSSCKQEYKTPLPEVSVHKLEDMVSPAGTASSLPHLVSNTAVTLLSWVETKGDSLATFYYAELKDGTWQKPEMIAKGRDWFVNWADYPMVAENNGNYWSHVLRKSTEGTYSYDVQMNLKPKGSTTWTTNLDLHTDDTPTEHGFVTVLPYNDSFFVTWLDGRNTEENEVGERGAMTLRAAAVSAEGTVSNEHELDIRTCDCCQTSAAVTHNGPVVVYRDRSEDEMRDISIVRQVEGRWTAPIRVHADNWKIKGCPVNGPRVAAMGNNLAVAWFTAAQDSARVQVAFSNDGGEQFQDPILVSAEHTLGRVDVVGIDDTTVAVSWMESKGEEAWFQLAKVSSDGTVSNTYTIAQMSTARKSGFPQMEKFKDTLYFAWTEVGPKENSQVRTAQLSIDAL